jgi:rSAM/selenodomain-associated transferase 1
MMVVRIVIFAKAPEPGRAKTRLIPELGAEGAARLARRMLEASVAEALGAAVGPVELCVAPAPDADVWKSLEPSLPQELLWSAQGDGDLGDRMARAARRVCDGGERVLLIGTDCPGLDRTRLRWAAEALDRADAVLFPTLDGGYALLGLRVFAVSLFSGIAWSTATVAAATRERINALGWTVESGEQLQDIDTPTDLAALPPAMWRK